MKRKEDGGCGLSENPRGGNPFYRYQGKNFYTQWTEPKYVSLSAIQNKRCISFSGKVRNIGSEKLEEIFEKNPYVQEIYPAGTRSALEVFQIYEGQGNFFDIRDPSYIQREELSHQGRKKKIFRSSPYVV